MLCLTTFGRFDRNNSLCSIHLLYIMLLGDYIDINMFGDFLVIFGID